MRSQSEQIKEIVEEGIKAEKEYQAKQMELRQRLCDLFGCGPGLPQREIVVRLFDLCLFPNP